MLIDYPPKEEYEERYMELPYPNLKLFTEITTDKQGDTLIADLGICKVYATGCITAGAHSSVLIEAEVSRIKEIMHSITAHPSTMKNV